MEEIFFDLIDFLKKPSIAETFVDILLCAVPIWLAVMIGLVIGWSWKPRWTGLLFLGLRSKFRFLWTAPPGFGARRLWLAFTALSAFSVCRTIWSNFKVKRGKESVADSDPRRDSLCSVPVSNFYFSSEPVKNDEVVIENDLEHLLHLLEGKAGPMEWQFLMERSNANMAYQAWQHVPQTGPIMYRSRTVFEDTTPEMVRDFFWDDEFRPKWDPMLAYVKILEEYPQTGTMIMHWVKKFPFFCSDREYIIARRIWEAGNTFYCVTKGVPYPGITKRDKPRRVELYFSSWVIRTVESRKGDGHLSACEVTLLHYEDMGIPKDVAKLGVRHGMWGTVKKLHSGLRAYQNARKSESSLSRCALMSRITNKISFEESMDSSDTVACKEDKRQIVDNRNHNNIGINWKWIVIGGTAAVVLGLHSGVVGKTLLFGAAARRGLRR